MIHSQFKIVGKFSFPNKFKHLKYSHREKVPAKAERPNGLINYDEFFDYALKNIKFWGQFLFTFTVCELTPGYCHGRNVPHISGNWVEGHKIPRAALPQEMLESEMSVGPEIFATLPIFHNPNQGGMKNEVILLWSNLPLTLVYEGDYKGLPDAEGCVDREILKELKPYYIPAETLCAVNERTIIAQKPANEKMESIKISMRLPYTQLHEVN